MLKTFPNPTQIFGSFYRTVAQEPSLIKRLIPFDINMVNFMIKVDPLKEKKLWYLLIRQPNALPDLLYIFELNSAHVLFFQQQKQSSKLQKAR
mmetsp:Transcript_17950/g.18164  ORF Transcript_17950/g.18164 Transcript_17950/m.18164 type:complete len:93 (-) Transcript_17950:686-964(-)